MNVLITGAGNEAGIALATATCLAQKGHLIYAGVHTEDQLQERLSKPHHHNIVFFKLDVTEPVDQRLCGELDIDVYIGNAALGMGGSMAEIDMDEVRKTFETNVFSMFAIAQQVLPGMIKKGNGRLIFMSSLSGDIPFKFLNPYAATKASIDVMGTALHQEMKVLNRGISVSVIKPGAYHTGFNQRIIDANIKEQKNLDVFGDKLPHEVRQEHIIFDLLEKQDLKPLVKKICHAATAKHPKGRYIAPRSHRVGAKLSGAFYRT